MNYYLNYGTRTDKSIEAVRKDLVNTLDIIDEKRSSDYFGEYYKCTGGSIDKLNIYTNNADLIQYPSEFQIVIDISFTKGRIEDRLTRYQIVKAELNKIEYLINFKDLTIED